MVSVRKSQKKILQVQTNALTYYNHSKINHNYSKEILKGISKNFSYGLRACVILVILLSFFTQVSSAQGDTAPYIPSYPSPADGAQNQLVNLRLSWSGGDSDGDTVTYTVYIDTSPSFNTASLKECSGSSNPTCDFNAGYYNTTYYWYVSAFDGYYTTNSPVWSFTTQMPSETTSPSPATAPPSVQTAEIIGVILILAGLIFTSLTALKKDVVIEVGIPERNLKYVGGVGILIIIIGVYVLLKSLSII